MTPAAIRLALRGFPVFPLAGKVPLPGTHGCKDATVDPNVIANWGHRWGHRGNVGIATGHEFQGGRLLVVDFDAPKEGEVPTEVAMGLLSALGVLTPTAGVRTGSGGLHLYYRAPLDGCPTVGARIKYAGQRPLILPVDWRGIGGYVVAPPSVHPKTGRRYCWEVDSEWTAPMIADVHPGLLDLMRRKSVGEDRPKWTPPTVDESRRYGPYYRKILESACNKIISAGQGQRHDVLRSESIRVSGYFRAWTNVDEAEAALVDAFCANKHGAKREALRTVRYGFGVGSAKPLKYPEEG
jgi:hypothetical protein